MLDPFVNFILEIDLKKKKRLPKGFCVVSIVWCDMGLYLLRFRKRRLIDRFHNT